ncbi:hypothetical protein C4D60_Mb02t14280 [Musa balbisiana]|uniref:Uncharacterized protein n=1 Tax=Musa balbisiana TaxID=52838 RepID=A0A4S8IAM2_MUSBA|nr:hypothetical protein C4D60_Mb02t14280 [Musa balbisiana]
MVSDAELVERLRGFLRAYDHHHHCGTPTARGRLRRRSLGQEGLRKAAGRPLPEPTSRTTRRKRRPRRRRRTRKVPERKRRKEEKKMEAVGRSWRRRRRRRRRRRKKGRMRRGVTKEATRRENQINSVTKSGSGEVALPNFVVFLLYYRILLLNGYGLIFVKRNCKTHRTEERSYVPEDCCHFSMSRELTCPVTPAKPEQNNKKPKKEREGKQQTRGSSGLLVPLPLSDDLMKILWYW